MVKSEGGKSNYSLVSVSNTLQADVSQCCVRSFFPSLDFELFSYDNEFKSSDQFIRATSC